VSAKDVQIDLTICWPLGQEEHRLHLVSVKITVELGKVTLEHCDVEYSPVTHRLQLLQTVFLALVPMANKALPVGHELQGLQIESTVPVQPADAYVPLLQTVQSKELEFEEKMNETVQYIVNTGTWSKNSSGYKAIRKFTHAALHKKV
jgi:hypothetical protein